MTVTFPVLLLTTPTVTVAEGIAQQPDLEAGLVALKHLDGVLRVDVNRRRPVRRHVVVDGIA